MIFGINPSVQDVAREMQAKLDRMAGCFIRELTEDECRTISVLIALYLDQEVELQVLRSQVVQQQPRRGRK